MATLPDRPSVHDVCINLALNTPSRVERYFLLRLAHRVERRTATDHALDLFNSAALVAVFPILAVPVQMVLMKIANAIPGSTTHPAATPAN